MERGPHNGQGPTNRHSFSAKQLAQYNERKNSMPAGNPTGKPGGQVAHVRKLTDDGKKILEFWAQIAFEGVDSTGRQWANRERLDASKLLYERGYGKPVEAHLVLDARNVGEQGEIELSNEQLTRLVHALAPPPGSPTVDVIDYTRGPDPYAPVEKHYAETPVVEWTGKREVHNAHLVNKYPDPTPSAELRAEELTDEEEPEP